MAHTKGPLITTESYDPLAALKMLGIDLKAKGEITARVLVRYQNQVKAKRYTVRVRKCDGHVVYRWGRLTAATAYYTNGKFTCVVFHPDAIDYAERRPAKATGA